MVTIFSYELSDMTYYIIVGFLILMLGIVLFLLYQQQESFGLLMAYAPVRYGNTPLDDHTYLNPGYDSATRGYYNYAFADQVARDLQN